MKKFLLFTAAAMMAASAMAEEVVLAETDFSKVDAYNFWKSDVTNAEVKDGALVITSTEAAANFWDVQYIVADNFTLTEGTEYTVSVKIKDFSGTLHYNLGTWGSNVGFDTKVEESADWQTVTVTATAKEDTDGTAHLLLQSGEFVGTYYVENVKITYNKAEGGEEPVEPTPGEEGTENVIATYFDGNGKTFGGWGGTFEQVTEDEKPCLKYSSTEAKDFWAVQMAIDMEYEIGTTYYISMDVKGDGAEAITSGFQYAGERDGSNVYWGCGNFTDFKATSEWKNVIISGEAQAPEQEAGTAPNRWVANLGQYVGDLYLTNVKVYTLKSSAVEAIATEAVEDAEPVYYNLQGLPVANPAAGQIYIVKKGNKVSKVIF